MKTAEEIIKKHFPNASRKAIKAWAIVLEEYHSQKTLTDEELMKLRDEYIEDWKKGNEEFCKNKELENTYWSGINDGMYLANNLIKEGKFIKKH